MDSQVTLTPIGTVRSPIHEPVDDVWGGVTCRIELDPARFSPASLAGLDEFSHVEIVFLFHQVPESKIEYAARHPRGRQDWPAAGIFAQRAKNRPNRLGITTCAVRAVKDLTLEVEGLEPYMTEFGPKGPLRQPLWATELMASYWNQPK